MNRICLIVFTILFAFSCQKEVEMKMLMDDIDDEFRVISTGSLIDLNTGHSLQGKVIFLTNSNNEKILRMEDFSVVNGPDVNVYLSKTSEFKDVIDLGDLRATQGNINYEIDPAINTTEYKFVLVWCIKYAVLFGYAEVK
jgi:hypothetical protein